MADNVIPCPSNAIALSTVICLVGRTSRSQPLPPSPSPPPSPQRYLLSGYILLPAVSTPPTNTRQHKHPSLQLPKPSVVYIQSGGHNTVLGTTSVLPTTIVLPTITTLPTTGHHVPTTSNYGQVARLPVVKNLT
ncbi:hypothetical protein Pmani_025602 [Petrolisthes manimaculis]|uniref:Uncharacterized protein n=1 Tax=Petrolisthes manimaculis TaxID=1843537 RepID=A0AAE1P7X0_9EUCA|nr:hypothetical protein Pmani_025602 [Petrolisthes manimaculis]